MFASSGESYWSDADGNPICDSDYTGESDCGPPDHTDVPELGATRTFFVVGTTERFVLWHTAVAGESALGDATDTARDVPIAELRR